MDDRYVVKLTKEFFELNDGTVFEFPFEMDELPSLEKFNKLYESWEHIINDKDKFYNVFDSLQN